MHYQVSRNGQLYGPYTFEDLQRYLASGNVQLTDLVKSEEMPEWIPVSQLMATQQPQPISTPAANFGPPVWAETPSTPAYTQPAISPYPDPPNLHWTLVLLFGFLTCSYFMYVWNIVVAAWVKRVQPNSTALFYYIAAAVLVVVGFFTRNPFAYRDMMMGGRYNPGYHMHHLGLGGIILCVQWVIRLVARFQQRESLLQHFNTVEPIGLRLSGVMTFFFGGVYFQYHLNRINAIKAAARYGAPRY